MARIPQTNDTDLHAVGDMALAWSREQTTALIHALLRGQAPVPVEEPAIEAWVEWARGVKISSTMIDLVLKGELDVRLPAEGAGADAYNFRLREER